MTRRQLIIGAMLSAPSPPRKHKPSAKTKPLKKAPKPSSIGPSKWYKGTDKYANGDQDSWSWYAPTLKPNKGTRKR